MKYTNNYQIHASRVLMIKEKLSDVNGSFSYLLHTPPPQRLNVLLYTSIWLWYFIVRYLQKYNVEISNVLLLRNYGDLHVAPTNKQLLQYARSFVAKVTKIFVPIHFIYQIIYHTWDDESLSGLYYTVYHSLPLAQFVVLVTLIIKESTIIKYCSRRLLLIESKPRSMRNVYILLSDSLTSFNRPLIDFTLFSSLLFGKPFLNLDLFLSTIPSGVRIFQCIREYFIMNDTEHLFNAGKYSSNIPIIACTWYMRTHSDSEIPKSFYPIQIWLLLLNSAYTFFWDVRMDWTITSVITLRKSKLTFAPKVYHFAIVADFILRFWWLWIIFYTQNSASKFIFFSSELYYFEVIRRANWIIFKLESEYVNRPIKS